jgi:hypothetical protein
MKSTAPTRFVHQINIKHQFYLCCQNIGFILLPVLSSINVNHPKLIFTLSFASIGTSGSMHIKLVTLEQNYFVSSEIILLITPYQFVPPFSPLTRTPLFCVMRVFSMLTVRNIQLLIWHLFIVWVRGSGPWESANNSELISPHACRPLILPSNHLTSWSHVSYQDFWFHIPLVLPNVHCIKKNITVSLKFKITSNKWCWAVYLTRHMV